MRALLGTDASFRAGLTVTLTATAKHPVDRASRGTMGCIRIIAPHDPDRARLLALCRRCEFRQVVAARSGATSRDDLAGSREVVQKMAGKQKTLA